MINDIHMNNKALRILAIDPGTRFNGVAILENCEILYFATKLITDRRSTRKIYRQGGEIVRDLIRAYNPSCVAIERVFGTQQRIRDLMLVVNEMKLESKKAGLPVYEYPSYIVRQEICGSSKTTKRDVAQFLGSLFKELSFHLHPLNDWEEKYYSHIFDAVAVGLFCEQDLQMKSYAA
jgi:Holliday junction resolvasome RuvABC endonuclease subunit